MKLIMKSKKKNLDIVTFCFSIKYFAKNMEDEIGFFLKIINLFKKNNRFSYDCIFLLNHP